MALSSKHGEGERHFWATSEVGAGLGPAWGHPASSARHPGAITAPTDPKPTLNHLRALAQHLPGESRGCPSPSQPLIKTPGMSWPLLIPIKSIQGINYQAGG